MTPAEISRSLIEQIHMTGGMVARCAQLNGHPDANTPQSIVLAHGIGRYCLRNRWRGVTRGRMKECYTNAAKLTISDTDRWVYCEGYAIRTDLGVVVGDHAFCLDLANGGEIVDPTWRNTKDAAYLGIPFNPKYLIRQLVETRRYGLLDAWWAGWPVLNNPPESWLHPSAAEIPRDFTVPTDLPDIGTMFAK